MNTNYISHEKAPSGKMKRERKVREIAIYSTVIKYPLFHEKTRDILFFERPQGARKIKFREFSSEIKDFTTVEYVVLFNEAG